MCWYRVDRRKTTIVDLLLAAHGIQFDDPDPFRVIKYGRWIVEREVSVLSDTQANQVDGSFGQKIREAPALSIDIIGFPSDWMKCFDIYLL